MSVADDKREPVPAADWSALTVGETVVIPRDLPWEAIGLPSPLDELEGDSPYTVSVAVTGPGEFTYTITPAIPPNDEEQP